MAIAYINNYDEHPYAAFLNPNGSHMTGSPVKIANNATFTYAVNCKVSENSIMVVMANLTEEASGTRYAYYRIIS